MPNITVVVPVGPQPAYRNYLEECLSSLFKQTRLPTEVLVIDDMADLSQTDVPGCKLFKNDWLLGCADSWNRGVALSQTDCVFLMGSDDTLMPECLEACWEAYQAYNGLAAWYNVTCALQDGSVQDLPNNAAMITKNLWRLTGGFPPSAFAAPDALLISIMLAHMPDRILQVRKGIPLYWCRQHPGQDTLRNAGRFNGPTIDIRGIETATWQPPDWTMNT